MQEPVRNRKQTLGQTWNHAVDVRPAATRVGTVSTLRVKFVGTAAEPDSATVASRAALGKTHAYANALPRASETLAAARPEREWREVSWQDVTVLEDEGDAARVDLAFAQTLPAVSREELGVESSGVHEVKSLQLALAPQDRKALAPQSQPATARDDYNTATLRIRPVAAEAPLTRAWHVWQQQSPFITIGTAATFCVLSALLVSLLAQ